jgi:hypothetical protein
MGYPTGEYYLWFSREDEGPFMNRVFYAIQAYFEKYGKPPTHCGVHPMMLIEAFGSIEKQIGQFIPNFEVRWAEKDLEVTDLKVDEKIVDVHIYSTNTVLMNHFLLSCEEKRIERAPMADNSPRGLNH